MRALRLVMVLLAAGAVVMSWGPAASARKPVPPWMTDPIAHNDGTCHLDRHGRDLGDCGYPVGPIPKSFPSCAAFSRWLSKPRNVAVTFWRLETHHMERPGDTGTVIAAGARGWLVIWQIIMYRFSWPHMTDVQQQRMREVLALVHNHEKGHVTVAEEFIKKLPEMRVKDWVKAENEETKDLDDPERQYDAVTHHGATQSKGPSEGFPGGDDVVWDGCS